MNIEVNWRALIDNEWTAYQSVRPTEFYSLAYFCSCCCAEIQLKITWARLKGREGAREREGEIKEKYCIRLHQLWALDLTMAKQTFETVSWRCRDTTASPRWAVIAKWGLRCFCIVSNLVSLLNIIGETINYWTASKIVYWNSIAAVDGCSSPHLNGKEMPARRHVAQYVIDDRQLKESAVPLQCAHSKRRV